MKECPAQRAAKTGNDPLGRVGQLETPGLAALHTLWGRGEQMSLKGFG